MTGVFALAAGAAPTPIALCGLTAAWSLGTGGNVPVDSVVFLDFMPATHQSLLAVLSVWWAVGQLFASLVSDVIAPHDTSNLRSLYHVCRMWDSDTGRLASHRQFLVLRRVGLPPLR